MTVEHDGTGDGGTGPGAPESYQRWPLPEIELEEISQVTVDQLEAVQEEAYEEGLARGLAEGERRGYEEGKARIEAELAPLFVHFRTLAEAMVEPLARLDDEVEASLVELSMAVARQLVLSELKARPELVLEVVRDSLRALPLASRGARVYLHPDDLEAAREALADSESEALRFLEDPSLTRGGCRVHTEMSSIDATVEQRIATVVEQVLGGESSPLARRAAEQARELPEPDPRP